MTGYNFSNSFPCSMLESRKRKPFFTGTETLFLVEQFEKQKEILTAKFCSTETNRRKNEIWTEITVGLHLRNPNVKRTVREVKKKWKNIVSMAKKEAIKAASDPDSSPRLISEVSQRVLDLFAYLPSLQNMQALENGQEDISEMRGYYGDANGNDGTNNDIFTLIRNETRPTSPSEGSELSTNDGQDTDRERPTPFGDAMPSTSAPLSTYRPEIEMVDLIKCETRSTSPSIVSDNSINDCPLLEGRLKSEDHLKATLSLPLTNDQGTENMVVTTGSTATASIRCSNKNNNNSNDAYSTESLMEPRPSSMHSDKLEIVSVTSIREQPNSLHNDITTLEDVSNINQQENYTVSRNEHSMSDISTAPVVISTSGSDGRIIEKVPSVPSTTAATVALTALCQSTLLTSNTSSGRLGSLPKVNKQSVVEEIAADDEPSQKRLKSIPSEYLELHHTILLLEKEKLQIEIQKMKREVVNQEKMTEILDIAKDVFVSLREKI